MASHGPQWAQGSPGEFSPGNVSALLALPNGDVLASGRFVIGSSYEYLARWNGSSWSRITGVTGINVLMVMPNGNVIGGSLSSTLFGPAGAVWRLNGSSWSSLGSFVSAGGVGMNTFVSVDALAQLPNGDLVVGGDFINVNGTPANRIARWDGTSWHALGSGMNGDVYALTTLPNGDLVAAGQFTTAGGVAANRVARWNGTSWSALGSGLGGDGLALTLAADGDLVTGGSFTTAGGAAAARIARLTTTCPASATPYGSGCTGSNGPLSLTADRLPWVGGTYQATATTFVANAIALELLGFSATSIPLSLVHPSAGAGCMLLVSPDVTQVLAPIAGKVTTLRAIPNDPSLVGGVLRHQIVQVQQGPNGLSGLHSTNALQLTLGSF